jgi:hypothetical protein
MNRMNFSFGDIDASMQKDFPDRFHNCAHYHQRHAVRVVVPSVRFIRMMHAQIFALPLYSRSSLIVCSSKMAEHDDSEAVMVTIDQYLGWCKQRQRHALQQNT